MEEEIKNSQTDLFCRELIARFFNEKSYFFLCLNSQLNLLENNANSHTEQEIFDIAQQLLASLISANDIIAQLKHISAFLNFDLLPFLCSQIYLIKQADTNSAGIKQTIEEIANNLSALLIENLQSKKRRYDFKVFFGQEKQIIRKTKNSEILDECQQIKVVDTIPELKQIPQGEALFSLFKEEIIAKLKEINETTDNLRKVSPENGSLKPLEKDLLELKTLSMIQGFDIIEDLAGKTANLLRIMREKHIKPENSFFDLMIKFSSTIHQFLAQQSEERAVKSYLELIKQTQLAFKNAKTNDHSNQQTLDLSEEIIEVPQHDKPPLEKKYSIPELLINQLDLSEQKVDPISTVRQAEQPGFKLPGEEDPELQELITEILQNQSGDSNEAACDEKTVEAESSYLEPIVIASDNQSKKPLENKNAEYDLGRLFKDETAFYLKIIDDAVKRLYHSPSDSNALEDIELASYSLKGVAQRLGFEMIGKLPACLEALAVNVSSNKTNVSVEILQLIEKSGNLLKNFKAFDELFRKKFNKAVYDFKKLSDLSAIDSKNEYSEVNDSANYWPLEY